MSLSNLLDNSADWDKMTHEQKNHLLYLKQKQMLDMFLEHGAISQAQHNKSLHDLTEKSAAAGRRTKDPKPVVLVVMDGVGESADELGNMVKKATTPTLDRLKENCPWRCIKAHGTAVGLRMMTWATARWDTMRSAAGRCIRRARSL